MKWKIQLMFMISHEKQHHHNTNHQRDRHYPGWRHPKKQQQDRNSPASPLSVQENDQLFALLGTLLSTLSRRFQRHKSRGFSPFNEKNELTFQIGQSTKLRKRSPTQGLSHKNSLEMLNSSDVMELLIGTPVNLY
jgi:hypothetical protein